MENNVTPDIVQATIRKESGEMCVIRARRVVNGIEFFFRSEKLEAFFKQGDSVASAGEWQGRRGYVIPLEYRNEHGVFKRWGISDLMVGEQVNLSMLLGKGLAEGYTVTLNNTVATQELVVQWIEKAKLAIKRHYQKHMAPFSVEVEISFREVG
jgi:hypothetical protein